jgi:predicted CXXCH cytochrome family protein
MAEQNSFKPVVFQPDVKGLAVPPPIRTWRSLVTFFAFVAAIICFVLAWMHKGNQLYNPGPVTFAHARFEHDCIQCHDGNGSGGFLKTVSDTACLKCHDGSIHHPNQQIRSAGEARSTLVLAVHDSSHPFGMRSTDCTSCHTEHQGNEALRGTSDANCIKCHDDLKAHAQNPADVLAQNSVTTFAEGAHPNFGRTSLKDGELFDPTVLKFNHYMHLTKFKWMQSNCIACHSTNAPGEHATAPPPPGTPNTQIAPPWLAEGDHTAAGSSDPRYMQPISYERDCIGCHRISIAKIADLQPSIEAKTLPHQPIVLLKGLIADMVHNAVEQPRFTHATTDRRNRSVMTTIKPAEWMVWTIAGLNKTIKPSVGAPGVSGQFAKIPDMTKPPTTAPSQDELQVVNFYAASLALSADGCIKCHEVHATLPTPDTSDRSGTQIITLPTKIPESPRRWFTNSRFDHAAHRDVSCVECHARLDNVEKMEPGSDAALLASRTSAVLSPSSPASCVKCHHADTSSERGAPVNCITCHDYHDRTKEK